VHHALAPLALAEVEAGSFETTGVITGVAPLFKMETAAPYSTVNQKADGTFWSSKIPSGPGSQDAPVASAADLVGKGTYTEATTVVTFGVGYASDGGNKATVTSITFADTKYDLTCQPEATPSATPSASPSTTKAPAASSTSTAPVTGSGGSLPVTGAGVTTLAVVGVALIAGGVVLVARRRRRFEA
jgi:LPXTG-motif cell wall-anchored protein